MVFNAVFNGISVVSRRPVHLFMFSWGSFNKYFAQYFFQATGFFPTYPLSKQWTVVRWEWILLQWLNPLKEYWPSWGSIQRPVLKSATVPTAMGLGQIIFEIVKTRLDKAPNQECMSPVNVIKAYFDEVCNSKYEILFVWNETKNIFSFYHTIFRHLKYFYFKLWNSLNIQFSTSMLQDDKW